MKIYLDNNIIVSIENGDYKIDKIKSLFSNENISFLYSSAHIFEVENFKGSANISISNLISKRFETIRTIFKNNYIYTDYNTHIATFLNEDPLEVYNTIMATPFGIEAMKGFMNLFSKEQKDQFRNELGIEISKLNNYNSVEIINHLNIRLTQFGNLSFLDMIEYGIKLHPDGNKFGLDNRIAGVFELLDMLGYWKDKETDTSNYARLWDAQHTFFATHCDYFISDDKRTRNKASVVYNIYNKSTKIISSSGN